MLAVEPSQEAQETPIAEPQTEPSPEPEAEPQPEPQPEPEPEPPSEELEPESPPDPQENGDEVITPTPLVPQPTPTTAHPIPYPSAYFVPIYRGSKTVDGLTSSVIQGRVLDFRGVGVSGLALTVRNGDVSLGTVTEADGGYVFGGIGAGIYTVVLEGYKSLPAENIYAAAGAMVTLDFQEAKLETESVSPEVSPVPVGTPSPDSPDEEGETTDGVLLDNEDRSRSAESTGQRAQPTGADGVSTRADLAGMSVVIIPMSTDDEPIESSAETAQSSSDWLPWLELEQVMDWLSIPWQSWGQAFLLGMIGTYLMILLGLAAAGLRR